MKSTRLDKQIGTAFDIFIESALTSDDTENLCDVAVNGGEHEAVIERIFRRTLSSQFGADAVPPKYRENYGKEHDVVVMRKTQKSVVVEIKSIFTDPGGISGKTGKGKGLEKDMQSLKLALDSGVLITYELVVLFECFAVSEEGESTNNPESGIKWPRKQRYAPGEGEQKVNDALKRLTREQSLKSKRIKGWTRVQLPNPKPNVRAFLDCAVYKVRLK